MILKHCSRALVPCLITVFEMAVLEEASNMPIILAFGRAKQGDPEFPDSLVYRVSFRLAWAIKAEILFKEKKNQSQSTNQLTEDKKGWECGSWAQELPCRLSGVRFLPSIQTNNKENLISVHLQC